MKEHGKRLLLCFVAVGRGRRPIRLGKERRWKGIDCSIASPKVPHCSIIFRFFFVAAVLIVVVVGNDAPASGTKRIGVNGRIGQRRYLVGGKKQGLGLLLHDVTGSSINHMVVGPDRVTRMVGFAIIVVAVAATALVVDLGRQCGGLVIIPMIICIDNRVVRRPFAKKSQFAKESSLLGTRRAGRGGGNADFVWIDESFTPSVP
jgi:hypothetical protein